MEFKLYQSNENTFTPSVSGHKYLELNLFDLRFLSEANLSIVMLSHLLSIISIKLGVVTQSSLSMFLLSAFACVLYFWGIPKTESLILKAEVTSKIFSASSVIFPCYLLCLQLKVTSTKKMITSQNVSSEAQVKNFFIS